MILALTPNKYLNLFSFFFFHYKITAFSPDELEEDNGGKTVREGMSEQVHTRRKVTQLHICNSKRHTDVFAQK